MIAALSALADTPLGRAAQEPVRARPAFLVNPETRNDHAFATFHAECPEFYWEVERRALALHAAGAARIGMAMIFEAIRYDATVGRLEGAAFKANNTYRAYYSRLLVHDHPELAALIETRHQRAEAA